MTNYIFFGLKNGGGGGCHCARDGSVVAVRLNMRRKTQKQNKI